MIQTHITQPLIGGKGGGLTGLISQGLGAFGANIPFPGLANGGTAQARQPVMVGERGPELFVPNVDGNVVPNNRLTGMGTTVNVTQQFNLSPGLQETVRAEILNAAPAIAANAEAGVFSAIERGGMASRAVTRRR